MAKRLLVVTTVAGDDARLRTEVRRSAGDGEPDVRVVAPAAKVSALDWLTNAEDDARAEAQQAAEQTASALGGEGRVEAQAGDTNVFQAIEDALREFPADEILLVTSPDEDATWLEKELDARLDERFGVPARRVELTS